MTGLYTVKAEDIVVIGKNSFDKPNKKNTEHLIKIIEVLLNNLEIKITLAKVLSCNYNKHFGAFTDKITTDIDKSL